MRRLVGVIAVVMALGCGGVATDEVAPPNGPVSVGPTGPDCVSFCQQTATCWASEHKPLGADESDCQASCKPDGSYTHMGPYGFVCATKACGAAFDDCEGNAMAQILGAGMSGAAMDPPAGYPAGFPFFSAGMAIPVPPAGPVKTLVFAFGSLPPADLAASVIAEAQRYGWTKASGGPAEEEGGTRTRARFTKDASTVSVSVYADEPGTVLQLIY